MRMKSAIKAINPVVKCKPMSEGRRQLIKIFGMLGICKTEDSLV